MLVCCSAAEKACISISDFLTKSCTWLCPTDRPSPIYIVFSFIMNITMIIISAIFLGKDAGQTCNTGGKCRGWYIAFFPLCIVNMVFAVYVYYKFMKNIQKGNRACGTMGKLLMYDLGVYFYLFINPIFVVIWLVMGHSMCGEEIICEHISNYGVLTALLGVFLGAGIFTFFLSVAVQCCYEDERGLDSNYRQYPGDGMGNGQQQQNGRDRRSDTEFRAGILSSVVGGSSSNRNNNTNSRRNDNNNNSSGSDALRVAGTVATVAAGAAVKVAGKGLSSIGNWMSGSGNKNDNNNASTNNKNNSANHYQQQQQSHQYQQAQAPPPAHHQQQQQQYQQPSPPQQNNMNIYNTTSPAASVVPPHAAHYQQAPPPQHHQPNDATNMPIPVAGQVVYENNNNNNQQQYYESPDCGSSNNNNNNSGLAPPPAQPQQNTAASSSSNNNNSNYAQPQW